MNSMNSMNDTSMNVSLNFYEFYEWHKQQSLCTTTTDFNLWIDGDNQHDLDDPGGFCDRWIKPVAVSLTWAG